MEKKNRKLIILVSILILGIGVSLAYFVSSTKINGSGSLVDVTTSEINGSVVKVEGILQLDDSNIYPGHKNISGVKVTATGDNELIPYNLIWEGTNSITTPLNYTVYKTSSLISTTTNCTKKTDIVSGMQQLSEECTISNIDSLGSSISSGTINKNDTKVILVEDEFITAISTGDINYYYIVLEYPNLDEPQNNDINGILNGKIKAEESNVKPDISILATYIEQDNGEYKQEEDIPQSGYVLNREKSTCSNGTIPGWNTKEHMFYTTNLTKSGTSCYLYFDKDPVQEMLTKLNITNINNTTPNFSNIATTNEGIFETEDKIYNGTTYYWRGAVTNNYVKFAGYCWRIIRINGDGSIRLIYDGTTCHANGQSTIESIAVKNQPYAIDTNINDKSYYVGWTWDATTNGGFQRPAINSSHETLTIEGTYSNARKQTEEWFNNTAKIGTNTAYLEKIADGKFCNDRNVGKPFSSLGWGTTYTTTWNTNAGDENRFAYAEAKRLYDDYNPIFNCPNGDVYTLKVGAITADEVEFAGGISKSNQSYYLYNGQNYWTMSPYFWYSSTYAGVFFVDSNGYLNANGINNSYGIRPVINLKSDTIFSSGNGLKDSPYIVAD